VLESIRWRQPSTWKVFGLKSQTEADTTAQLAYNQGYYNLFLAIQIILGIALSHFQSHLTRGIGQALAGYAAISMVAASLVLLSTGRRNLRSASIQGVAPAIGVTLLLKSLN
jgi:putative membrane protein